MSSNAAAVISFRPKATRQAANIGTVDAYPLSLLRMTSSTVGKPAAKAVSGWPILSISAAFHTLSTAA